MALLEELKRRNVIRVSTLYVVASWVILQVADLLAGVVGVPDWSLRLVLIILVLGFPLVVVFSWVFEMTPEGIVRDSEARAASAADARKTQRLDIATVVLLVLAIVLVAWDRWSPGAADQSAVQPSDAASMPSSTLTQAESRNGTPSIAVLPFVNMSAHAENEYFSDGLTDTLLHKLAQVRALKVAARTSSFAFKGTNTDIREIAQTLSVANVLEGSVQRAGNKVRITAQLIQASDGYHLWSGNFDRELDDIFKVQDEIATQVAKALTGSLLSEAELAAQRSGGTENSAAYDAYLRGREAFRVGTIESLAQSERLLRQAVTLDPEFALAWAALAEAIARNGVMQRLDYEEVRDQMHAAADRAAELAPNNATVLAIKGIFTLVQRRMGEGHALLRQAVDLDPSNVSALTRLATSEFFFGNHAEAVKLHLRAIALDPLDFDAKADLLWKYGQMGELQKARDLAEELLAQQPRSVLLRQQLGYAYDHSGELAQAYTVYRDLLADDANTPFMRLRLASLFARLDDEDRAMHWFRSEEASGPSSSQYTRAQFCLDQGMTECAARYLKTELEEMVDGRLLDEDWRAVYRSRLAELSGDWETAWREQRASLNRTEARSDVWWSTMVKPRAALAADRLGLKTERDLLLTELAEYADRTARNGDRSYSPHFYRLVGHALRNEPEQAANMLRSALDAGYRNLPELLHDPTFDDVREAPPMQAAMGELRTVLAAERAKVEAIIAEEEAEG